MARIKNMKNAKKVENPGVLLKRLMGYIMKHYGAAFLAFFIFFIRAISIHLRSHQSLRHP